MIHENHLPSGLKSQTRSSSNDPQEREHIWFIINRAYQNIYGLNLPTCSDYQKTIFDAALSVYNDDRSDSFSDKGFIQLCEDIIRISDEHSRLSRRHLSRASNPVYLRETALDNALESQKYMKAIGATAPASTIMQAHEVHERISRKNPAKRPTSADMMELAYQQLSINSVTTK